MNVLQSLIARSLLHGIPWTHPHFYTPASLLITDFQSNHCNIVYTPAPISAECIGYCISVSVNLTVRTITATAQYLNMLSVPEQLKLIQWIKQQSSEAVSDKILWPTLRYLETPYNQETGRKAVKLSHWIHLKSSLQLDNERQIQSKQFLDQSISALSSLVTPAA